MRPHNYVEDEVFSLTDRLAEGDEDFCGCEKCRADVAAYALSHLKPVYASSTSGRAIARAALIDSEHHAEITAKVAQALSAVKTRPRH